MNRRQFIKAGLPVAVIPAIAITCKYEDDEKGEASLTGTTLPPETFWPYVVYCYEREQGEWIFTQNLKGSFDYRHEYVAFDDFPEPNGYMGFMYDCKLHFQTLYDATEFIDIHVRTKNDMNVEDSIYDVYYKNPDARDSDEIQVAHYWFNGDTGSQIKWVNKNEPPHANQNKIESS